MKDSNAPPLARFIPHPAGRAPVVTAVKPPGKTVGNLAVTGKHPGRYTTNPGCLVANIGDRLLFFISQICQRPQDLTTSEDVLLMPTGRLTLSD